MTGPPTDTGSFSSAYAAELRVDGYRVREVLGAGGHSTVYLAHDAGGRPVALKRWRVPGEEARVEREADALQRLSHPHLVRFVALCRDHEGAPCLVMEHVRGRTLAEALQADGRLAAGPDLAARVAALLTALMGALEHMHAHGLVHRDVKPANVILREEDGAPVLVDLSVVKPLRPESTRLTSTSAPVGTSAYMAPEQCAGDLGPVDARTDLYGVGATLFHTLTGLPPWTHETGWERSRRNPWRDPYPTQPVERARVLAAQASVPEALGRVVARCLEGAPSARYRDLAALRAALRAAAAPGSPRAGPLLIAASLAALATLALAVSSGFRDPSPSAAPRTVQEGSMNRSVSTVMAVATAAVLSSVVAAQEPPLSWQDQAAALMVEGHRHLQAAMDDPGARTTRLPQALRAFRAAQQVLRKRAASCPVQEQGQVRRALEDADAMIFFCLKLGPQDPAAPPLPLDAARARSLLERAAALEAESRGDRDQELVALSTYLKAAERGLGTEWGLEAQRRALELQRRLRVPAPRAQAPARVTPMRIGGWTPEACAKGMLVIPLGPAGSGQYELEWRYESGPYGIQINECALLEDDVVVSRDAHPAWAGFSPRRNTFLLRLDAVKPGARYALRADIRQPEGWGTASQGSVWLAVRPDAR